MRRVRRYKLFFVYRLVAFFPGASGSPLRGDSSFAACTNSSKRSLGTARTPRMTVLKCLNSGVESKDGSLRWSFSSPAGRKIIRSSRALAAFARLAGLDEARGRAAAFASSITSWPNRGRSSWLRFTPNRERRRFRAADQNVLAKTRGTRSRKQQREGDNHGRPQIEHWGQEANQTRHGAGAERQRNPGPREG